MEKLGIDPLLIGTQALNFFILAYVLQRFLYKPVVRMLDQRKADVQSVEKAKSEMDELKKEMHSEKEDLIHEGRKQADEIIATARAQGEKIREKIEGEAADQAQEIIRRGEETLEHKARAIQSEISADVAQVALQVSESVLRAQLSDDQKKVVLSESVETFGNNKKNNE